MILNIDGYKSGHHEQYPEGTEFVYSNWTARKSRIAGVNHVKFFGLQYFIKRYLLEDFQNNFFSLGKEQAVKNYSEVMDLYLGKNVSTKHIEELHDLGYLPIVIKALPEGQLVPIGVPMITIRNTNKRFFWLTNYIETIMSCSLWQMCTTATVADVFYKKLAGWAQKTNPEEIDFVKFQGHDFSFRGMSSLESAKMSGAAHLLSFSGTDTIPAINFLKKYYGATGFIGGSIPATEHSVSSIGGEDNELETIKRLINVVYPSGFVSIVSDTWNLWNVVSDFLPSLKNDILRRDGRVVIRPDSSKTTPQDIICGTPPEKRTWSYENPLWNQAEEKGLIECLWGTFGGRISSTGYKVLNPKIGAIYGDAITLDRAEEICQRLEKKGFASTNLVFGIGSFTYQYNTRDTFGFAMKATYGVVNGVAKDVYKNPITDSGEKKSATGLLRVDNGVLTDKCTLEQEDGGDLKTVFKNGHLMKDYVFTNGDLS